MYLWLGFVIAIIILHVALHNNLVIVKGYLVAMVLTIPQHSLRKSWVEFKRLGLERR